LNAGETAWWEFNEGSGSTAGDSSGHGYDGIVYSATWTADGLSFDGMDDYVDFDAHALALGINKTDDITIIVRFRTAGSGMLFSMSHTNPDRAYFDLMIDDEGKITVEMGDKTCLFDLSTSDSYNDGEWHIVESEYYGDTTNPTMNLYIDGELKNTTTEWVIPMIDEDFQTVKVGRNSNTEGEYLDGEVDDVKYYKNAFFDPEPPGAPTISGPTKGKPGQILTYTFNSIDPAGDNVRFHIDWGDGEEPIITLWVASGTDKSVSNIWGGEGTFIIQAYAEDHWGNYGPSSTFMVFITKDKATNNMLLWRIVERFPLLQKLIQNLGL
jgi:hypothetical protein